MSAVIQYIYHFLGGHKDYCLEESFQHLQDEWIYIDADLNEETNDNDFVLVKFPVIGPESNMQPGCGGIPCDSSLQVPYIGGKSTQPSGEEFDQFSEDQTGLSLPEQAKDE